MKESEIGLICGIIQSVIGHPIDTIKVLIQNNNKNIKYSFTNLYKGITYPLLNSMFVGYALFGLVDEINIYYNNYFISGGLSGIFIFPIIQVSEYWKINAQMHKNIYFKYFYVGSYSTLIRESIASSIYFGGYHCLNDSGLSSFLSGGISGSLSWLLTYPIDVIKTRVQQYPHISYNKALKIGGLYNGISITLFRGFLVNGCVFFTYDTIKKTNWSFY